MTPYLLILRIVDSWNGIVDRLVGVHGTRDTEKGKTLSGKIFLDPIPADIDGEI